MTAEDLAVWGKLLVILGELGDSLVLQDTMPIVWDQGAHRLYQMCVLCRDDHVPSEEKVCSILGGLNAVGSIKPQLYSIEEYPDRRNFTRCYVTLFV